QFAREKPKLTIEERVVRSAERALEGQQHVSAIDVLVNMGLLSSSSVDSWRRGYVAYLEDVIQGHPQKVGRAMQFFHEWATSRGLQPIEARYVRTTREGDAELRFTDVKYPELDQALRSNFVSPKMTARKKESVEKKLTASPERVVFIPTRDGACSECGVG